MNQSIYIEDKIIFDTKEKIVVNHEFNTNILEEISDTFSIVKYIQKGKDLFFYISDEDNRQYKEEIRYLPSNVLVFVGTDDIKDIVGGSKIVNIENLNSNQILKAIYDLKINKANKQLLEAKRDNYEIRSLLENAKNTLLELSLFVNSSKLPLHKTDLSFEVDKDTKTHFLKGGETVIQYLPVSSYSVSGIRLFFSNNDKDNSYTSTDILKVELMTLEGDNIIGLWEVPFTALSEDIVLELVSPYIKTKETLAIIIRNTAQQTVELLSSKKVKNDKWNARRLNSDNQLLLAPLALEIYKSYHTVSLSHSTFIKKSDTIIPEFEHLFLSKNILQKIKIFPLKEDVILDEEELLYFKEDNIRMTTNKMLQASVLNAVGSGVTGLTARLHSVSSQASKAGVLLLPANNIYDFIDIRLLEEYESEGLFSGWKKIQEKDTTLHLILNEMTREPHHLYLLLSNTMANDSCTVEWTNFEIITNNI